MTDERNGCLALPIYERTFGTEVTGDFTLPDYQNEIRRILCVKATALPPAKYLSDSAIEFNGTLDYRIVYVGTDGNITSASLSSEYAFSVPLEKNDGFSDVRVLCSVGVDGVSTRVSAPRRLNIRCRLRPSVRAYGCLAPTSPAMAGLDPSSVYSKFEETDTLWCASANSDTVSVSCVFPDIPEDMAVASADTLVEISDVSAERDRLTCRGVARIELLCAGENGNLRTLESEIPLEGEIDVPNMPDGVSACVRGIVADTAVSVGDAGIECTVGVVLSAQTFANERVEYVSDAYSTERECESQVKNVSVRKLLLAKPASFSVNERISLADANIPPMAEILFAEANANMDKCASDDKKIVFTGKTDFSVAWRNDGDTSVSSVSVPVRYEIEADEADNDSSVESFESYFEVKGIKARLENGQLVLTAELVGYVNAFAGSDARVLDKISLGEPLDKRDTRIVVAYPAADDTVWSLAKKYRVAPKRIMGDPERDRFVLVE